MTAHLLLLIAYHHDHEISPFASLEIFLHFTVEMKTDSFIYLSEIIIHRSSDGKM